MSTNASSVLLSFLPVASIDQNYTKGSLSHITNETLLWHQIKISYNLLVKINQIKLPVKFVLSKHYISISNKYALQAYTSKRNRLG